MITNRWIEKRQPHWDQLTRLLAKVQAHGLASLPHDELRQMAFLYRQIASDLSALRQDRSAPIIQRSLNELLARTHNVLYSGRKGGFRIVYRFLWYDYPVIFRKLLPVITASLVLFLAGGLLGTLLTLARPEFMRALLGPGMLRSIERHEMWTHSITGMAPQAASAIMTNNLSVTFFTFASGIFAGLGTLYSIGFNGILLGVVATACARAHMSVDLWSFVASHGALELPAIVLAGGAGFRIAQGLLFPGNYKRRHALLMATTDAIKLMAGVIPMLVVAGSLEGFLSPSAAPVAVKFAVGGMLFVCLLIWLFPVREREPDAAPWDVA